MKQEKKFKIYLIRTKHGEKDELSYISARCLEEALGIERRRLKPKPPTPGKYLHDREVLSAEYVMDLPESFTPKAQLLMFSVSRYSEALWTISDTFRWEGQLREWALDRIFKRSAVGAEIYRYSDKVCEFFGIPGKQPILDSFNVRY